VAPGEIVALAGSTGAGKSSIVKLLNRMYDPDEGDIEIDGINIRDVTLSSLRRQIGVVPQSPHIFSGTIRDNLLFANPEASEDELQNAVTLSRLNKVIECFPDGLDTECGERGLQLSAGQKQLISIARLFLLRPAILILDEATSNIDRNLEYEIEIALKTLLEKRTAIIVSHRLYNLQSANRIYVLQEGKIVEKGDYESLERSGGWFSEALLKQKNQID
jgi:ABC-type multidrug transport system fused ATPase/permease subunit